MPPTTQYVVYGRNDTQPRNDRILWPPEQKAKSRPRRRHAETQRHREHLVARWTLLERANATYRDQTDHPIIGCTLVPRLPEIPDSIRLSGFYP